MFVNNTKRKVLFIAKTENNEGDEAAAELNMMLYVRVKVHSVQTVESRLFAKAEPELTQ